MADNFPYDVFLSHSAKDKDTVRDIAKRLGADGLRVWFDEWEIKPGHSIPAKINDGLERSRVLVLCMSVNAFGSDWAQLEVGTFRFRDPLNKDLRFIPLRLDDAPIKGSLAQFASIGWLADDHEREYPRLLEACRPPQNRPEAEQQASRARFEAKVLSLGHADSVHSVAISPDGTRALTGSHDRTVRVWDLESGRCLLVLEGHDGLVWSVAWSGDGRRALSGATDRTVRIWDVESGRCLRSLQGHDGGDLSVAWSGDGRHALSGADDATVRIWDVESGLCLRSLQGHDGPVRSVAWSGDGRRALSGAADNTVRIWDVESGRCLRSLQGHDGGVWSVAWSGDGRRALSGADDATVRIWDVESGLCLRSLQGHDGPVWSVAWSGDGRCALSGATENTRRP
jgi:dipeptidyl aminopeptidase/acylaminoacyl peptidase